MPPNRDQAGMDTEGLVLTFRVTERYDQNYATGKIRLSNEYTERPYPVTREQAELCAEDCGARFEEVSDGH